MKINLRRPIQTQRNRLRRCCKTAPWPDPPRWVGPTPCQVNGVSPGNFMNSCDDRAVDCFHKRFPEDVPNRDCGQRKKISCGNKKRVRARAIHECSGMFRANSHGDSCRGWAGSGKGAGPESSRGPESVSRTAALVPHQPAATAPRLASSAPQARACRASRRASSSRTCSRRSPSAASSSERHSSAT